MASSDTLTFDDDPPHRAALSELGGGAKQNHALRPPNSTTMMTAEDCNQFSQQLAAVNRVMPLAVIWVRFAAGVPSIHVMQAAGTNVVAGDFTVTDTGTGDTLIVWTTGVGGKLPAAVGVKASQTDDIEIDRIRAILTTSGGNPAANVKTKLGAVATDCNFCLEIF